MILTPPIKKRQESRQRVDIPVNGSGAHRNGNGHATKAPKPGKIKFAPWKVVLVSLLIGIAGYFYISHVFTTQAIYSEVNTLQREHNNAQRAYNEKALTYDRMTGPADVYRRARERGLVHGGASDPIIKIKP